MLSIERSSPGTRRVQRAVALLDSVTAYAPGLRTLELSNRDLTSRRASLRLFGATAFGTLDIEPRNRHAGEA